VQYASIDALKQMLGDPQVLVIDVRAPESWAASDKMIQGAVRREDATVATWGPALPRD